MVSKVCIKCPQCGVVLKADAFSIGAKAKCAECGFKFIVQKNQIVSLTNSSASQFDKDDFFHLIKLPFIVDNEIGRILSTLGIVICFLASFIFLCIDNKRSRDDFQSVKSWITKTFGCFACCC